MRLNNISVYGFGLLAVFSFLWGSFVFYRRALELHQDEAQILDSVVLAGFWSFILGRLIYALTNLAVFGNHWSRFFLLTNYPGLSRWGVILGVVAGVGLLLRKVKGKFVDWMDMVAVGVTAGTAVFFAGMAVISLKWQFALLAFLYLLGFIYFWLVEGRYRTLSWYRNNKTSARSGFVAGFSLSFWGVLFLAEELLLGVFGWGTSAPGAFILFVSGLILVYIRSGRTAKEDINTIFRHGKK